MFDYVYEAGFLCVTPRCPHIVHPPTSLGFFNELRYVLITLEVETLLLHSHTRQSLCILAEAPFFLRKEKYFHSLISHSKFPVML